MIKRTAASNIGCDLFMRVKTFSLCEYSHGSHMDWKKTGKPEKLGKHFPITEKLGDFEQTGKVRKFYPKYWKSEVIGSFADSK